MYLSFKTLRYLKPVIFILLLIPSLFWTYQFLHNNLGVNPIEKLMHNLGEMALRLILFTLIISNLSQVKSLRSLQNIRRLVGLFAFYYVVLHLISYVVLDYYFNWNLIIKDIIKRPFITFGFISFILLIPLAVTSTDYMLKKLTFKVWKNIHKLIYLVALLAILHFFLLTKADKIEPIIYMAILSLLFFLRVLKFLYKKKYI